MSDEPTDTQRQMAACLMIKAIAHNAKLPESVETAAMDAYCAMLAPSEIAKSDVEAALRLNEQFCHENQLRMPADDYAALAICLADRIIARG